ncbi:hypothetical protein BGX38DRAFT_1226907 [Terfezia claveryi]|nr:hypothetical protein BGX38DRAFT_1226907 [Terfezia claveryi]
MGRARGSKNLVMHRAHRKRLLRHDAEFFLPAGIITMSTKLVEIITKEVDHARRGKMNTYVDSLTEEDKLYLVAMADKRPRGGDEANQEAPPRSELGRMKTLLLKDPSLWENNSFPKCFYQRFEVLLQFCTKHSNQYTSSHSLRVYRRIDFPPKKYQYT